MRHLLVLLLCSSCTLNIVQTSTHAPGNDVVDADPTTETKTDANANLQVPLTK